MADKDRGPIKDIIVDWGMEGGVSASSPGKYKNRKVECNNSSFGDSPGACEKAYFEFFGSYTFAPGTPACRYSMGGASPDGFTDANRTQLTRFGLKSGHRYCAFKPRVIVIDNWGWCNGTCAGGGCWGSDDPELKNKCTDSSHADYPKVGTPFNGWVIVAEQK